MQGLHSVAPNPCKGATVRQMAQHVWVKSGAGGCSFAAQERAVRGCWPRRWWGSEAQHLGSGQGRPRGQLLPARLGEETWAAQSEGCPFWRGLALSREGLMSGPSGACWVAGSGPGPGLWLGGWSRGAGAGRTGCDRHEGTRRPPTWACEASGLASPTPPLARLTPTFPCPCHQGPKATEIQLHDANSKPLSNRRGRLGGFIGLGWSGLGGSGVWCVGWPEAGSTRPPCTASLYTETCLPGRGHPPHPQPKDASQKLHPRFWKIN